MKAFNQWQLSTTESGEGVNDLLIWTVHRIYALLEHSCGVLGGKTAPSFLRPDLCRVGFTHGDHIGGRYAEESAGKPFGSVRILRIENRR